MTNCTAAAPARAMRAPVRKNATPSPAIAPTADEVKRHEPSPHPQWLELGLQHARRLSDLLYVLVDVNDGDKAQGLIQELVETAEAHLCRIAHEDSPINVSIDGVLYCQVSMVVAMLEAAWYAAEHGPLDYPPHLHEAVIPSAIQYAKHLTEALREAPLTDKLHALAEPNTIAGARPRRNQPTPEKEDKNLVSALKAIATQASTLSCFLWQAKDTAEQNHDLRAANDFLVAQGLAEYIGVLADESTGSSYIGGALAWAEGAAA